jgi:cell division protein FtsB
VDKLVKFVKRFPAVIGVMVLLVVLFAFTQRVGEYLRLSSQQEREATRLTELVATQAALEDQIAYATSQAAVEEWAREDARWAQEGDFVVIPLPPAGVTPQPAAQFSATATPSSNWDAWMSWLFSSNP